MHLKCIRVHLFSSFSLVHIKRTTQLLEMTQNMLIAITFGKTKKENNQCDEYLLKCCTHLRRKSFTLEVLVVFVPWPEL